MVSVGDVEKNKIPAASDQNLASRTISQEARSTCWPARGAKAGSVPKAVVGQLEVFPTTSLQPQAAFVLLWRTFEPVGSAPTTTRVQEGTRQHLFASGIVNAEPSYTKRLLTHEGLAKREVRRQRLMTKRDVEVVDDVSGTTDCLTVLSTNSHKERWQTIRLLPGQGHRFPRGEGGRPRRSRPARGAAAQFQVAAGAKSMRQQGRDENATKGDRSTGLSLLGERGVVGRRKG